MWGGLHVLTRAARRLPERISPLQGAGWLSATVCALFFLHLMHILVWASCYRFYDLLPNFETAMYFSATSYATLGYGDVLLAEKWRILGPFEGVTGVLMFGWSTGVLFLVANKVNRMLHASKAPS
jgi:hypothetical protein